MCCKCMYMPYSEVRVTFVPDLEPEKNPFFFRTGTGTGTPLFFLPEPEPAPEPFFFLTETGTGTGASFFIPEPGTATGTKTLSAY